MQPVDHCPSCAGGSWRRLGEARFDAAESETVSDYVRKRYRVLFELWCPGQAECTVTFLACETCGMVVYSPRPSEAELDEKYRFLVGLDAGNSRDRAGDPSDAWRARDLYRQLRPFVSASRAARILDFGGGDGRLLAHLLRDGHECAIIDWCAQPVAGVRWLGHTLDEIDPGEKFDIIVASHVMEHVAGPREVLQALGRLLVPGGIVYVEVPLEIWGGPPRMAEPVTHVNFFVPGSLSRLMRNSGLAVLNCSMAQIRYHNGWLRVVRVVAGVDHKRAAARIQVPGGPVAEIDRFLQPSLKMRLSQRLMNPQSWAGAARYRITRLLRLH